MAHPEDLKEDSLPRTERKRNLLLVMILAAPLVIPFAKAVGLSVGTLGKSGNTRRWPRSF